MALLPFQCDSSRRTACTQRPRDRTDQAKLPIHWRPGYVSIRIRCLQPKKLPWSHLIRRFGHFASIMIACPRIYNRRRRSICQKHGIKAAIILRLRHPQTHVTLFDECALRPSLTWRRPTGTATGRSPQVLPVLRDCMLGRRIRRTTSYLREPRKDYFYATKKGGLDDLAAAHQNESFPYAMSETKRLQTQRQED